MKNNDFIKGILEKEDIALLGFADLSEIDGNSRQGFLYGVCIAIALKRFPSIADEPSQAYYEEYKTVSAKLRRTSDLIAEKIKEQGFRAYSLSGEKQDADYRTRLPLKTLATRAGLGWIGKSAALVTKEYGSALRLGGILTDMPFLTATPQNSSLCGNCTKCVKSCPAGAITGKAWSLHTDRDELLDAFACKRTVVERGRQMRLTEGTCGICISSCPWTKMYRSKLSFSE